MCYTFHTETVHRHDGQSRPILLSVLVADHCHNGTDAASYREKGHLQHSWHKDMSNLRLQMSRNTAYLSVVTLMSVSLSRPTMNG